MTKSSVLLSDTETYGSESSDALFRRQIDFEIEMGKVESDFTAEDEDHQPLGKAIFAGLVTP